MKSITVVLALTLGVAAPASADWPKYCGNLAMNGAAESGGAISPALARYLVQLWTAKLNGPVASQPAIVHDVVYIGDWSGTEWALDAATGLPLAHADLGTTTAPQCTPSQIGITSTPAVAEGVVYVAGGDDGFYALDATTLAVIWRRSLGDNSASGGYYGWCSPAVTSARVIQGVSSNCDDPFIPGRVVSLDLFDGTPRDTAWMIEPDWPHDTIGAGVWTSPAIDEAMNEIFVTTGSAFQLEDGHSYSIVRIGADGLDIRDAWKVTGVNSEDDADWGSSPTLFTSSEGTRLVGAGQKDGHYYAFARHALADGPVWKTMLAKGGACPLCADGVLSTAAFDGTRLYVGSGRPPNDATALGAVVALNPDDGTVLWRHTFAAPVIAPISYANGVVFTTTGSSAVALDSGTGDLLWQGKTAAMCVGGVAITERGIVFGDLAGNVYAYGVPAELPTSRTRVWRTR